MFNLLKRRWLIMLLIVTLFSPSSFPFVTDNHVHASECADVTPGDDAACPIMIYDYDGLDDMRSGLDKHYALGDHIDMTGKAWDPVGAPGGLDYFFTGTFNGNGYTISNLTVSGSYAALGLFGMVFEAVISNIGLVNVDIKVTGTGTHNAGGLVGNAQFSTIANSYVTGSVSAVSNGNIGGLVGNATGNEFSPSRILNSYASVEVSRENTGTGELGGFIGRTQGTSVIIQSSFYNSDTADQYAQAKSTVQMKEANTFDTWDFSSEDGWGIVEGMTFPIHRTTFDHITLSGLTIGTGDDDITPTFEGNTLAYSTRVTADVSAVTVNANKNYNLSTVTIAGDDGETNTISLPSIDNNIDIEISTPLSLPGTAMNPFVRTYSLNVIREDGLTYPHRITNSSQLESIGTLPYEWTHRYELMNDLDLTGNWNPIGNSTTPFAGTFDGKGHVIHNMTIHTPNDDVGLFGASSGTIQHIGLENVLITGGNYVGALIGSNSGTVINTYAKGKVNGDDFVGGLIGQMNGGSVGNSYAAVDVDATSHVGGLIGDTTAGSVDNAYWDVEGSELSISAGGTGYETEDMLSKSKYLGWDFDTTWAMIDGSSYPMFIRHFDEVKLQTLTITPTVGSVSWSSSGFDPAKGIYELNASRYVQSVDINVTPADPNATVTIGETTASSANVPVKVGSNNEIWIRTTPTYANPEGAYRLNITVPPLETDNLTVPPDGYYAIGDTMSFTLSYEGNVDVVNTPRIPIIIGTGSSTTVYADYSEQPEPNKLTFTYIVEEGLSDTDGIQIGTIIDLPDGAAIYAASTTDAASLVLPVTATNGILVDAIRPTLTFSQDPTGPTNGVVTITVDADGTGNTIDTSKSKWLLGSRTIGDFAADGQPITGDNFVVSMNGIYTVYVEDQAGNGNVAQIDIGNIASALQLSLSHSPTSPSTSVTVSASVYTIGIGNTITNLNWLSGSHLVDDFADGANGTDFLASRAFTVTNNDVYTVYARDAVDNETVAEISITNIATMSQLSLSHSPTSPSTSVTVSASVYAQGSGNSITNLNWLSGSRVVEDFADGANRNDILASRAFTVTSNGVYTVYARDAANNEAVAEISIANIRSTSSEEDSTVSVSDLNLPLLSIDASGRVNIRIDSSHLVKLTQVDGTIVEYFEITDAIMEQILSLLEDASNYNVLVYIDDTEQALQMQIAGSALSKIKDAYPDTIFAIILNASSYQLPVNAWNLAPQTKHVNILITKVAGEVKDQLVAGARLAGLTPISPVIDYRVTISSDEATIELEDFGGTYIHRSIVLDENSSGQQRIAVLYNLITRTFSFVPAVTTTREDGKTEMLIKVPHNSIYTIVETGHRSFSDIQGHWAKSNIEFMASKLLVSGISTRQFAPDKAITRAEFTALLVRALGLRMNPVVQNLGFDDVSQKDWFAPVVEAGVQAGLVRGVSTHAFAPNDPISREQLAVILSNTQLYLGYPQFNTKEISAALRNYRDRSDISAWARNAVAQSIATGMIHGMTEDTIAPSQAATRAQAVVILHRFLKYIAFID